MVASGITRKEFGMKDSGERLQTARTRVRGREEGPLNARRLLVFG